MGRGFSKYVVEPSNNILSHFKGESLNIPIVIAGVASVLNIVAFLAWSYASGGPFRPFWRSVLRLPCPYKVEGIVESGYEAVKEAFEQNFKEGLEKGAQLCIYIKGKPVVDLWGANLTTDPEYNHESLQVVFSSSKVLESLVIAMLVDRGLLEYDQPIAKYWPEFGANGKEHISVAELMRHEAGLDIFCEPIAEKIIYGENQKGLAELIERSKPEWGPHSKRFYHAYTRGFISNELVKRVDPQHRHMGTFVKQDIADPLGVEVYFGLPEKLEPNVARLGSYPTLYTILVNLPVVFGIGNPELLTVMKHIRTDQFQKNRMSKVMAPLADKNEQKDSTNSKRHHAVVATSYNGITRAPDYAKLFAAVANGGSINGVKLLSSDALAKAIETTGPVIDGQFGFKSTFTNCGWAENFLKLKGEGWYGWMGYGGSVTQFNIKHNISIVYTMNGLCPMMNDKRTQRVLKAFENCFFK